MGNTNSGPLTFRFSLSQRYTLQKKQRWYTHPNCNPASAYNHLVFPFKHFCSNKKHHQELLVPGDPLTFLFLPPTVWKDEKKTYSSNLEESKYSEAISGIFVNLLWKLFFPPSSTFLAGFKENERGEFYKLLWLHHTISYGSGGNTIKKFVLSGTFFRLKFLVLYFNLN